MRLIQSFCPVVIGALDCFLAVSRQRGAADSYITPAMLVVNSMVQRRVLPGGFEATSRMKTASKTTRIMASPAILHVPKIIGNMLNTPISAPQLQVRKFPISPEPMTGMEK